MHVYHKQYEIRKPDALGTLRAVVERRHGLPRRATEVELLVETDEDLETTKHQKKTKKQSLEPQQIKIMV